MRKDGRGSGALHLPACAFNTSTRRRPGWEGWLQIDNDLIEGAFWHIVYAGVVAMVADIAGRIDRFQYDLDGFTAIVPCGIRDRGVTSMARELGRDPGLPAVARSAAAHMAEVFGMRLEASWPEAGHRQPGEETEASS